MARILLVDDEASILTVLCTLLKGEGYEVVPVQGGDKARSVLTSGEFDLLISDIRMTPVDGMQLLRLAHEECPRLPVVMLTAYGSVETAIEALKLGAFDYVTKPFRVDELLITVKRALEFNTTLAENEEMKIQLGPRYRLENLVGESMAMQNVCEMTKRVAPTNTPVLILGEAGSGKEAVARAIHALSRRRDRPFLVVNCAALQDTFLESEMFGHVRGAFPDATSTKQGAFELASGGTILLDEIGVMSLGLQGKLLRSLQEKEIRKIGSAESTAIDVRILAATSIRLESLIEHGKFREDLYYRLSVIPIEVRPVRERREDILPLFQHMLQRELGPERPIPTIDGKTCTVLQAYKWPGNVREVEAVAKHAAALAKDNRITLAALPPQIATTPLPSGLGQEAQANPHRAKSLKAFLRSKEKEYLRQVLEMKEGNKEDAAKTLKISLATLYRKLPQQD
jgi:two-component system, NtrC family, response regulator PilR